MVVYNWVSASGPLQVTGRLEVTDIDSPLQNSGSSYDITTSPVTGRLIDFLIQPLNYVGGMHIRPDGPYECCGVLWGYQFDFANGLFYGGEGSLLITRIGPTYDDERLLAPAYIEVLHDESYPFDHAISYGHWQRESMLIQEPVIIFELLALVILFALRKRI